MRSPSGVSRTVFRFFSDMLESMSLTVASTVTGHLSGPSGSSDFSSAWHGLARRKLEMSAMRKRFMRAHVVYPAKPPGSSGLCEICWTPVSPEIGLQHSFRPSCDRDSQWHVWDFEPVGNKPMAASGRGFPTAAFGHKASSTVRRRCWTSRTNRRRLGSALTRRRAPTGPVVTRPPPAGNRGTVPLHRSAGEMPPIDRAMHCVCSWRCRQLPR